MSVLIKLLCIDGVVHLTDITNKSDFIFKTITNDIQGIDSTFIASMFNNVLQKDINRPEGKVDVLIGYQYAAYHPQKEQNNGHLLLLENRFGKCVGGSHPMIKETTQRLNKIVDAKIHLVDTISINDFYRM